MRLALLSDLHANRQALDACLADARAREATQYAFLGDLVGYGAEPGAVVDCVMALAERGAWVLRGNHDDAALAPVAGSQRADQAGAAWTQAQLSSGQREFLGALPLVVRHEFLFLVHASAHRPERWDYVDEPRSAAASLEAASAEGASHVFSGHVHAQRLFYQGAGRSVMAFEPRQNAAISLGRHRRWHATVGSVGQPRDGSSLAMYALFDLPTLQLSFQRVDYDHETSARKIREAGLPESNAARLSKGT